MRGVYPSRGAQRPRRAGSSPHARGLRVGRADRSVDWGIIPACAGFTAGTEAFSGQVPDHPRMRGVYPPPCPRSPPRPGSSPHARGLHEDTNLERSLVRIIPACAGFTNLFRLTSMAPPDHPRMRGVYSRPPLNVLPTPGSSPHARGLRHLGVDAGQPGRIIPACAGFTSHPCCLCRVCRDHPRMRGVYSVMVDPDEIEQGSSPHARGLRVGVSCPRPVMRIIPACAGFTGAGCR